MTNPTLRAIANDLRRLDSPGAFAAHHPESGLGLGIEVQGVGECRFPLATERIRELMAQAIPSPFGYFEQTLHDRTVRDSWEIEADRIRLDPRAWEVRLTRGVQAIAAALGFPPEAVVTPTLRKLLIYEPGQFFARHRDSEKEPGTVATLAIVLPSTYTGGEIVVTHGGQQLDFATAAESLANRLAFLGFYVDCVHETRPVSSGYRVVLTFTLQVESARLRPVPNTDRIEHLRASLARYFRLSDGDWLVHLLQHQYSEQGIDWGRLKNGDRIRAEALRRVARDLDCVCFLALADAVEGYDYHGPDLSVDDGEEDDDPSVPAWVALAGPLRSEPTWWSLTWPRPPLLPEMMAWPGGLLCIEEPPEVDKGIGTYCGREVTLRTWIDERGERCVGPEEEVSDGSIVLVEERHDWASYSASADPWRGNEGGVASKWFRVTAIVVVPRDTWDPFEQEPAPDTPPAPRRILRRRAGQG